MHTQPFDYLDKACLAATDGARGCSNAPTWTLEIEGEPPQTAVEQALRWLCLVHPSCMATVAAVAGTPDAARELVWRWPDEVPMQQLLEVVDLRAADAHAADQLLQATRDRYLDLLVRPPLLLVLARLPGGRTHLHVKQHHGLADGHGMVEWLADLQRFLRHAEAGTEPTAAERTPVPRRAELDAFGLGTWQRRWLLLGGVLEYLRSAWRELRVPLTPLRQNLSLDYSGSNCTLHVAVAAERLARWRQAARAVDANLNHWLLAAFFLANARWNRAQGVQVRRMNATTALDFRPRDRPFRSFANHLGFHIPEIDFRAEPGLAAMAATIRHQVREQNTRQAPLKRYLLERWVASTLPLGKFRTLLFTSAKTVVNLNYSNVLALPIAPISGAGWRVVDVWVSTPLIPRTAVVLTLTQYDGRATLNFNWKDSVVQRADVEAIRDLMLDALDAAAAGGTA